MLPLKRRVNFQMPLRLDLGCKKKRLQGFVGLDIRDFGQQIVWDVRDGLPIPDGAVIDIVAHSYLEHLHDGELDNIFEEMYRVCRNGAKIDIVVPHTDSRESYYIGHQSLWNEKRIHGICKGFKRGKAFDILKMDREGIALHVILKVNKHADT